jgi:hypothetical protein
VGHPLGPAFRDDPREFDKPLDRFAVIDEALGLGEVLRSQGTTSATATRTSGADHERRLPGSNDPALVRLWAVVRAL